MQQTLERPSWLKKRIISSENIFATKKILSGCSVNTVCESGMCPNLNECFSKRQATFLILGERCTRDCGFCSVGKGATLAVDPKEPLKILDAVRKLGLKYVVVTSVTRDDLDDGGAGQFADVVGIIKGFSQEIKVEVLVPDFGGGRAAAESIVKAGPDVFGHNIETVSTLYPAVRPGASYERSLGLLKFAKEIKPALITKSALMLGLGESEDDVINTIRDIKRAECDILVVGQYLSPGKNNIPVKRFIDLSGFERFKDIAKGLGFKYVACGPFARSSYLAEEAYLAVSLGLHKIPSPL